jgi:NADH dehydrogenase/NADH:ubiquinone oxidoreductase subunit G
MSITITVDGRECRCEPGEFLAGVAARNGIHIPTLCGASAALLGRGCCRVCIVEIIEAGRRRTVTSCIYPISQPCEVITASEKILRERGMVLALLQHLAPESELIAKMSKQYAVPGAGQLVANPDGGKCILCGLCVEACEALGASAISTVGRGVSKKISTPYDDQSPYCLGCGACAAICPTGNIPVQTTEGSRIIWGREFELVRCEICGEAIGTRESLAESSRRAADGESHGSRQLGGMDLLGRPLCPEHKRQHLAAGLSNGPSHEA